MSEQTKTVHFSLGANFGTLMGNLAQERLIFNLDPIHALKTFTDSFIGMPEDLALQLLSGKEYVLVPISDGEVTVRERIDGDDYPMLNGTEIIDNFVSQTNKEAKEFGKAICATFQMPVTTRNYTVDLSLSFNDLVSLFELNGHDKSEFYESLKDKAEGIKDDILYAVERGRISQDSKGNKYYCWGILFPDPNDSLGPDKFVLLTNRTSKEPNSSFRITHPPKTDESL